MVVVVVDLELGNSVRQMQLQFNVSLILLLCY